MLPEKKRKQIIDLMNREVVPAMGCTEDRKSTRLNSSH